MLALLMIPNLALFVSALGRKLIRLTRPVGVELLASRWQIGPGIVAEPAQLQGLSQDNWCRRRVEPFGASVGHAAGGNGVGTQDDQGCSETDAPGQSFGQSLRDRKTLKNFREMQMVHITHIRAFARLSILRRDTGFPCVKGMIGATMAFPPLHGGAKRGGPRFS